jgi:hypothetical protein
MSTYDFAVGLAEEVHPILGVSVPPVQHQTINRGLDFSFTSPLTTVVPYITVCIKAQKPKPDFGRKSVCFFVL